MKQKTHVYKYSAEVKPEIDFEAAHGWFVHSMVSTRLEQWEREEGDNDRVLVVYRKAKE
jgi:hypothetical protein